MAKKRKSEASGSGKLKQTTIAFTKKSEHTAAAGGVAPQKQPNPQATAAAAIPSTAAASPAVAPAAAAPKLVAATLLFEEFEVIPLLEPGAAHQLENHADAYKSAWADKCAARGAAACKRGSGDKLGKTDLDGSGIQFIESCKTTLQQAFRQGVGLQRKVLDVLVLMLRNDMVHEHPQISRQAYSLLSSYLQRYPAVSLAQNEEGRPVVVTSMQRLPQFSSADPSDRLKHTANFWSSLEDNRRSFTCDYLLTADIEVSGSNYKLATGGTEEHRLDRRKQLRTPFDLLLCLFKEAADSDTHNWDGDLLMLHYLLTVLSQDLRCRLTVFDAYAEEASRNDAIQKKRKTLLENSLLWRICEDALVGPDTKLELMRVVMQLVSTAGSAALEALDCSDGSAAGSGNQQLDLPALKGPGDVEMASAAAACIFTKQQLGALAARFLRMQLELFGAVEAVGAFHCTSRSRSTGLNLRMQLDQQMLLCFWGKEAVCVNDELSRTFLRCLPPRDRMRLLGLLVAQTFQGTYKEWLDMHTRLPELKRAAHLLQHGGEAEGFLDVNMLQAVQSITKDQSRAIKVYRNINLLSFVVASIALTLHALAANGPGETLLSEGSPVLGGGSVANLCSELHTALKGLVDRSSEQGLLLGDQSKLELVHAQMALTALAH